MSTTCTTVLPLAHAAMQMYSHTLPGSSPAALMSSTDSAVGAAAAARTGFKHKRADFKSKRTQHELPASFAEIDNEFTRSLAGGGGRRRSGRGAPARRARVGRAARNCAGGVW